MTIRINALKEMLRAEVAVKEAFEELSEVERKIYESATGVKETKVYSGPEGTIHKQEMLSGDQYRATRNNKNHYHASQRGALSWLKKQHAKSLTK
jgi:hypothetical protein